MDALYAILKNVVQRIFLPIPILSLVAAGDIFCWLNKDA
jgi:hypothetical protein